jgi:hypothetical protein
MSDDMIFTADPPAASSPVAKVLSAAQDAASGISATVRESLQPGYPLDQFSRLTRETPLRCLLVAYLIGAYVAHRR